MRRFHSSPPGSQAITDVYDEKRQTFLVRYPLPLLLGLSLLGAVALLLAGFLGYGDDPGPVKALFHDAWPLFLWLCGALIALQLSILRHPALRRGAVAACIVTVFALVLVGAWEYAALQPVRMLTNLLAPLTDSNSAGRLPVYPVADFGMLALFWGDAVRRWVTRLRAAKTGLPANAPTFAEMICGDLIAGGVLALVLAWIFQPAVIAALSNLLAGAHVLNLAPQIHTATPKACSLAVDACASATGQPLTLSFLDLALALLALSLGLFVLAISAMFSGLAALGATGQVAGGEVVSETDRVSRNVLGTVGRALNRRFHIAIDNVGVALRLVAWPLMTGISVFSAATTARYLWQALHANSDAHTCQAAGCGDWFATLAQGWSFEALALAGLLVTALTCVLAVALLVGSWRVVENTLRFLRGVGFIGLLTFWIFSLALSGLNGALNLLRVSAHVPFPQPGLLTIISFGAMVAYAVVMLARQHKAQSVAAAAMAGAPSVALVSAGEAHAAPSVRGIERQGA